MFDRDPLIRARALSFAYAESAVPVLDRLDFIVHRGDYLALLGANGCGKSTLLKLLAGLLRPAGGDLYVEADAVACVMQSADDQIVATVVEDDVAFGPEQRGVPNDEVRRRVDAALAAVDLESSRRKPPHFLSGGERQRLCIAGALAMETPVLALDEAASMLDPQARAELLELLDSLVAAGKTILHVTHSMEEAARAARVLVLHAGRIVFDGSPSELFARAELQDWGLLPPEALVCAEILSSAFGTFVPRRIDPAGFAEDAASFLRGKPVPVRPPSVAGGTGNAARIIDARSSRGAALDFAEVSHVYLRGTPFQTDALREVTFSLPVGTSLALIGVGGSGKSTALRHANALLLPASGRVLTLGRDTLDPTVDLRRLRLQAALSVQQPESLLFARYVGDDVAYGPRNGGKTGRALVDAVRQGMELANLPYDDYRDRESATLSGGEKRKAALACVLALDAEVYLFDEPTAGLDPISRTEILRRIARLRVDGAAIAATTHSMEEAAAFDRIVVMHEGSVVAAGTPAELFYEQYDPAWGLALPWAVEVVHRLRSRGIDVPGKPVDARSLAAALTGSPESADLRAAEVPGADGKPMSVPARLARGRRRGGVGLEFFRNATLGQYLDIPSPIRDLSARMKYAGLALLFFLAFARPHPLAPLFSLVASLCLGYAAKLHPSYLLRGYIPALPFLGLTILFQLGFSWPNDTSAVLLRFAFLDVTAAEIERSALLCARLAAIMAALALFSAVTPLSQAIAGIAAFLAPLRAIGVPVRDVAMVIGIVLRFVPVLVEEAERIAAGQLSRGGGYAGRGRVRAGLALTVPLFTRALERAESLAVAMELRGYRGDNRTDA